MGEGSVMLYPYPFRSNYSKTAFIPKMVSGFAFHQDASVVSAQNIATGVSNSADLSGLGSPATQDTGARQPAYVDTYNGLRTITFDGNDDRLDYGKTTLGGVNFFCEAGNPWTLFIIAQYDDQNGTVFSRANNSISNRILTFQIDSGGAATRLRGGQTSLTQPRADFVNGVPCLVMLRWDGTAATCRFNGGAAQTLNVGTATDSTDNVVIGRRTDSFPKAMRLHEIFGYSRAIDDAERALIEGYFAWKNGLLQVLPDAHPYKDRPPIAIGTRYDADVSLYIQSVETADGDLLEMAVKEAINNFVLTLKANGAWDAIHTIVLLAGARTLTGALIPLKGNAPTNSNFVSADYNRETGLKGNGTTKLLDTNVNNNIAPQDSNHMAMWATEADSLSNTRIFMSIVDLAAGRNAIFRGSVVSQMGVQIRGASSTTIANMTGITGFIGASRGDSTEVVYRGLGANSTLTQASAAPVAGNIGFMGRLDAIAHTNARMAFYSIGEDVNLAHYEAAVNELLTRLAAAI